MAKEDNTSKMLTILLVIVIAISAIIVLYINIPQNKTDDGKIDNSETNEESETILTVIYGNEQINFSMDEIKAMDSYTGQGAKINKKLTITGPYNFTGIKMSTILSELENLPTNYSIDTTSTDGYLQHYTYNQIQGVVEKLNETRASLGNVSLTMIVVYMQEGEEITDPDDGPLMIAFVDDYYTDSGLWARMLASIEIIEE